MSEKKLKNYFRLFITGFSMGTADLIPGVSGGTVAFLSGIYEELLSSIKLVTGDVLKLFLSLKFAEGIRLIPFKFLIPLALGLFSALFSLASLLSYLLSTYPIFVWAFFFGLVLASVYVVVKRVKKWGRVNGFSFMISAVIAFAIVGVAPVETPTTLIAFFVAGMIAIVAMILPGISGSFILLLLGKYQQVLGAVTERNFIALIVFALGAVFGLALFSRVLTWLFTRHHDISVAILAGFMLGSIRKIWPWKEVILTRINSHGEVVPLVEKNILPAILDMSVVVVVLLAIIGAAVVLYLGKLNLVKEQTGDLTTSQIKTARK